MTRIVLSMLIASALAGCMQTRPGSAVQLGAASPGNKVENRAAERKLAETLPLGTAESMTAKNGWSKETELSEELNRDARRLDSARNVAKSSE